MAKIQTKTTGLFILIAVITSSLVAILALWKSSQILKNEAVEKLLYQTRFQASAFEKDLSQLENITKSVEAMISAYYPDEGINKDNIKKLKAQLSNQMEKLGKKMEALSLWLVFNPELVPEGQNIDFYDKDRDGSFTKAKPYNIDDFDLQSSHMKWWTDALKYGKIWTEPYYWKDWDMELITYSKAIYIDSVFIGCIGSDIDFTEKRKEWNNIQLYSSGYIVLINQNFKFIQHPTYSNQDGSNVLPKNLFTHLTNNVNKTREGFIDYNFSGTQKVLAFKNLSNHWILMSVIPTKEIYEPIYEIGNSLLIILVLVILFSIGISILFSKSITSPIEKLSLLFNEAKNGDLSVRSNFKTNDELENLGTQFNYFLSQMQTMISKLKEDEIKLTEAKEKAEESDKLKTAFLENLSHEIRTPLTGIVGYAELLITEGFSFEEKIEFLETIQKNNDNLLQFVEDIITFSKLERGIIHSQKNNFQLHSIVEDLLSELIPLYLNQNNQIEFITSVSLHNSNIHIVTDYNLLIKTLKILLDNAFKFTNRGNIEFGCFSNENQWGFFIKDTGIGIPKKYHDLIFKKFYKYSNDKTKIYRGVGMGLAIADKILSILNGTITVNSETGKGSCFLIEFNLNKYSSIKNDE